MLTAWRFPWKMLLLLWALMSSLLVVIFWKAALNQDFVDPDDFMRLQQIRDFVAGQSWFDLTQWRMAAPGGVAMHWSRLVDLPVLMFIIPLTPMIGAPMAEAVATIAAPLLNLFVLMVAMVATTRRLVGTNIATSVLACLTMMSAPSIFLQVHPARIDHHGWQIALAAIVVAALVDRNARRSGLIAGLALALYLNISVEGMPLVAVAIGALGLMWVFNREDGARLTAMLWALALGGLVSNLLTAPYYRWTEGLCDALMPSHLAAFAVAAVGTSVSVQFGTRGGPATRLVLLAAAAAATIAMFGAMAPNCLGSPFGKLDPVIDRYWYQYVSEGMPFWRQGPIEAAWTIAFPLMALPGTLIALMRAKTPEMRRRWMIMLAFGIGTLLTGAMVRRAAGVAHVVAVPGALVLIGIAIRAAEARLPSIARVFATATAILAMTPIMPIFVVAAMVPDRAGSRDRQAVPNKCDRLCVLGRLAMRPPETLITSKDIGPIVVFHTPHRVFSGGYHRITGPLRDSIIFFAASPDWGRAFIKAKNIRTIIIDPDSDEIALFIRDAPNGLAARLAKGPLPDWLIEDPAGSPALRVYRVR